MFLHLFYKLPLQLWAIALPWPACYIGHTASWQSPWSQCLHAYSPSLLQLFLCSHTSRVSKWSKGLVIESYRHSLGVRQAWIKTISFTWLLSKMKARWTKKVTTWPTSLWLKESNIGTRTLGPSWVQYSPPSSIKEHSLSVCFRQTLTIYYNLTILRYIIER